MTTNWLSEVINKVLTVNEIHAREHDQLELGPKAAILLRAENSAIIDGQNHVTALAIVASDLAKRWH